MPTNVNIEDAVDYNKNRQVTGKMTDAEIAMLVAFLQEYAPDEVVASVVGADNLMVDAKFGDKSDQVLAKVFNLFARATPPPEAPALPPTPAPVVTDPFVSALLAICDSEKGNGEELFDNSGPHIVRYRGLPATYATKNLGSWHHWCSFSAGYMIRQAYTKLSRTGDGDFMMFSDSNFGKQMPIGGARDLVRRAADSKYGRWVARHGKILEPIKPGDIVAIRYNGDPSEMRGPGHVFIVRTAEGDMGRKVTTWEGNLGPFPAKWTSRKRDLLALGGSALLLQAARLA